MEQTARFHRQPTPLQGEHPPLIVEGLTSLLTASYLFYLVYTSPSLPSSSPLLPITILLLLLVTCSFHLSTMDVALARQGVVQGHCLVPILATVLLFHDAVHAPTSTTTTTATTTAAANAAASAMYNSASVAALILCSAVSAVSVGVPSLCPRRRTHTPGKVQRNTFFAMALTALGGTFLFVFVLGLSSARYYTYFVVVFVTLKTLLPKIFAKSFTMGECVMISLLVTVLWVDSSLLLVDVVATGMYGSSGGSGSGGDGGSGRIFSTMAWPSAWHRGASTTNNNNNNNMVPLLIECGLAGSFVLVFMLIPFVIAAIRDAVQLKKNTNSNSNSKGSTTIATVRPVPACPFYSTLVIGVVAVLCGTYFVLKSTNPVLYLIEYILSTPQHLYYLGYW